MPVHTFEDFPAPRILVIDDNPTVHDAFDGILRRERISDALDADEAALFGTPVEPKIAPPVCEIDHALSGAEGIEKARQAIEATRPYQLAFVDIRMPGMDGVETIEHLWKIDARIQTVICTAYADYEWTDLAKRFGNTDRLLVLKKPFHEIEVMQLASTLARKWFMEKTAGMKLEQMETLVAQRTQRLLELHRREDQQLHELDQSKLRSMQRLAQDFRGPLTLILNPIEEGLKGKALEPQQLAAVHRNVQKLSELLENSLLMRRLELEDRKLAFKEIDLVTLIRGTMSGFSAMAREKEVRMEFTLESDEQPVWTDETILEQILSNLFSRVLKSSEPHRNISVQLRSARDLAIIRMEINGIAATDSDWAALLNSVRANSALETDVVLLLCRELLSVLNGHLEIELVHRSESKSADGIRFTVSLPETHSELPPAEVSEISEADVGSDEKDLPLILLVESDHDFRKFIRDAFTEDHRCIEAETFDVAVSVARENVPDLIIADFDATQNDPILFCEQLKNDQLTSHIPLIVLGGEISDSLQLRALQVGVDDCLAKPFRLALLKARVANLLETRRKLHRHFEELKSVQPRELAANQIDAEFLRRVVVIVEKNLADYEFDVETLARQMGVSRRQLFRKFKAIAGCTPNVFIRDLRLKHAAQLLQESGLTVSEIIYAVGFSDPKYFRTVFRERFGVLPGEFGKGAKSHAPGSGI